MNEEIKANRQRSEEKSDRSEFDVLLSYNSKDSERVETIANQLKDNGLAPWLDKWELRPGLPWIPSWEEAIEKTKSAAIFFGKEGLAPWQQMGRFALLNELTERNCPVIPIFLETAPADLKLPLSLKVMPSVDFRKKDPDPLERLIWGITGEHPAKVYRPGVLIASLGESPAVIPAMYDLLTQREGLTLDRVVVLHPEGEGIQEAFRLVRETLRNEVQVESAPLHLVDADSWQKSCSFLQDLYKLLTPYQRQGDAIYLSLAGGRKSMAALMAWIVPFFPCIKGLYHVIDKAHDHFPFLNDIIHMPASQKARLMRPELDHLLLVDIPCEEQQSISQGLHEALSGTSPENFEQAEATITGRIIFQGKTTPDLLATRLAIEQFQKLDAHLAQAVHKMLLAMSQTDIKQLPPERSESCPYRPPRSQSFTLRSFIDPAQPIRPIFFTRVSSENPDNPAEQIILCALETAGPEGYRKLKEIAHTPGFSFIPRDELPEPPSPTNSVLIVPLGKSPMVATQLYTLLKEREQHTIHEIVLLYPQGSTEIGNAAHMVREALSENEETVRCTLQGIPDMEDITSRADCKRYQECLEQEIIRVQGKYPSDYKIDLALSGGRKGMTAMAIFAAQKTGLPYLYHTLITDRILSEEHEEQITSDEIEEQTTVNALNSTRLTRRERNDRLFLRAPAYREGETYPYERFVLFRVPVFSPQGWTIKER